jgi:hypothetical protein
VGIAAIAALAVPVTGTSANADGGCAVGFKDQGFGVCEAALVATGALQTRAVPAGVTSMQLIVTGGEGGMSLDQGTGSGSPGGLGGRESATVPVTPGATLQIVVGQTGGVADLINPPTPPHGGGGAPGGPYGGYGAGGTFVFSSATGLLIAAGGGGGGGYDYNPDASGQAVPQGAGGGAGSGTASAGDGASVAFCCDTTFPPPTHVAPGGGKGATTTGPGAGGVPVGANPGFGPSDGNPGQGPATDPLNLGVGGAGPASPGTSGCFDSWAGGGGGGYYGGGSGGNISCDLEGGGGGGGAGFVRAGATGATSGTGVQSGDGTALIRYTRRAPSAPTGVKAVPGPTTTATGPLRVSFVAGASNGSPITKYTVTCTSTNKGVTATKTGAKSPITVTRLTTGKTYKCTVKATNARGTSPASAPTPAAVVGAPRSPTSVKALRVAKGQLKVTFLPGANNGSPITNFTATCTSTNKGVTAKKTGAKSPITVTGLTAGKTYQCTVAAANVRGAGLPSAPSTSTTA